jgi:cytochrome c
MGEPVKRSLMVLGMVMGCTVVAGSGIVLGQDAGKKSSGAAKSGTNAAAVARGKDLFQQKCALCHYDTSEQKKIGPGLKGLNKRGTFSVNGNKVTDENLKTWIENGDQLMPPFKDVLEPGQIKDVIAYVRTLYGTESEDWLAESESFGTKKNPWFGRVPTRGF